MFMTKHSSDARLLTEIEAFMDRASMSATSFGVEAMGDRHLVRRLRQGGTVQQKTADKIRDFIEKHKLPPKKRAEARAA